ncbi:MAG TPA: hypothetical protein VFM29_03920, partial [Vicinamibacteria bacterium]|nr:hypothetical protein [Vicinamibacteria bacterium]
MLIRSGALAASAVSLRLLPSAAPVPLSYAQALSQGGVTWPSMPPTLSVPVLPGEDVTVQLAVVRASMTGALAESVLEITNGLGARRLVPVSALQFGAEVAPSLQLGTVAAAIGPGPALRGMWVGTVTVNAVSEAQSAILDPDPTATPTRSEFNFRILLHVGLDNKTRLLKEVTQMFRPGTDTTPSGFVLVTDDSQISKFKGASLRDGDPVGYRITSAVYDFPSGLPDNAVVMSGIFGPGGSPLEATIELLPDAKTNPFRHAFHPDHDNLDAQYEALPSTDQEVYTIRRRLRLAFDPITPEKLAANPGYGTKVLEGSYQEIFGEVGLLEDADGNVVTDPNTGLPIEVNVGGLHRNVIKVQGTFRLTRLTLTAELNK